MKIFEQLGKYNYEQLVFCHDEEAGLKAIICIHNTMLGPALGGTRMWNYASEEEAITDALRLGRGMSYKNAAAGLNLGGAKAVIIGDARRDKTEKLFRAFGRFVDSLGGRYITAEDVGTSTQDMEYIHMETPHVAGLAGAGASGNPSPVTAYGVYRGMKAAAKEAFGDDSLKGKVIALQGVGNVGFTVCKYAHEEGAKLIVADIYDDGVKKAVAEFGATAVAPDAIFDQQCDIFSPCALGAIINDDTVNRLKCKAIAGAANNQLKEERHGDILEQRGIVYAPDFIVNAGGVINIADELQNGSYDLNRAMASVSLVYDYTQKVFEIAKRDHIPSYKAAERVAEERIAAISKVRRTYLG